MVYGDSMNKILIINKEKDYTSRDVVNIVSKKLGTKKVGHFGTLDPLAEGVLVLGIGKYTKLLNLLPHYRPFLPAFSIKSMISLCLL